MRRLAVLLSALIFALAMTGEALAKDKKPKPTDADKKAQKEQAQEHKFKQEESASKGAPLIRFHGSHSRSGSDWLHEKSRKGY